MTGTAMHRTKQTAWQTAWLRAASWVTLSLAAASVSAGAVVITLRQPAAATGRIVRLRDIAELSGGDLSLRSRIAGLDIAERPAGNNKEAITRTQVEFRIRLAGFRSAAFRVQGAETVELSNGAVSSREATSEIEKHVLSELRESLARRLGVDPRDVLPRITRAIRSPIRASEFDGTARPIRVILPANVRPGPVRLNVEIFDRYGRRSVVPVELELAVMRTMPKAAGRILKGTRFSSRNVEFERRAVSTVGNPVSDLLGKTAMRTIEQGEMISAEHVRESAAKSNPVVIRPRDTVSVIARKPGLTVRLNTAEALQSGRIGQTIRLRNPQSRKVITGRVVSRSVVEIQL